MWTPDPLLWGLEAQSQDLTAALGGGGLGFRGLGFRGWGVWGSGHSGLCGLGPLERNSSELYKVRRVYGDVEANQPASQVVCLLTTSSTW